MARLHGTRTHCLNRSTRARDRVWTSMRILRRFSYPQLVASAECSRDNVRKYMYGLISAGIVRVQTEKRNGFKGSHQTMMLIINVGPVAPRIQKDGNVYDPNGHRLFLPGGEIQPCGKSISDPATSVQKK